MEEHFIIIAGYLSDGQILVPGKFKSYRTVEWFT